MGGAPTIDGGMTEDQYRQLQSEEREWQGELEAQKYERAMEHEKEQREFELAQAEKLETQKNAEELALEAGETAIQGEITAQDEEEEEEGNMGGEFMDALAKNTTMNPRPE